jgi:hypothetical protein
MKRNMGSADRAIRLLVAAIIVVMYFSNIITGTVGIILLALAGVLMITSFAGLCPLYTLLGINTREVKKAQ